MDYDEVQLAGDGELIQRTPYLAYKREDTRVVTYVLSRDEVPVRAGWTWVHTAKEARAHCTARFGKIIEENAAGDHLFLRVFKDRK